MGKQAVQARVAAAVAVCALASGCVSLVPFERVRAEVGDAGFVQVGGQRVHVEQAGEGEPVVLLHGFGGSTYLWRQMTPRLAGHFRVVAIDLNGFGWTERPRAREAYTLEGQAALVLGVLDALGIERAHLVGHSYGGGLAIWLAAQHPERVRSLSLVASTLPTYASARRSRWAAWRPLVALFVRTRALREGFVRRGLERAVADPTIVTDELVRAYLARLRVEGATRAFQGLTAPTSEVRPEVRLEALHVPTLGVWGEQDRLLSVEAGARGVGRIPGSRFVRLPGVGHLPMEEAPDRLAAALEEFLAAQP
ncbi:MAG TPA: alpha/beta fold hydrolase [Thermoanaerobaculaceae bacterium]|nr:alpha/beta fold hydrolase [Thermoanaerobaculaceae bacterium]HRS17633.1 alpha/beta fold hydrolase [Thermoanaerobaculaceae bacterium]